MEKVSQKTSLKKLFEFDFKEVIRNPLSLLLLSYALLWLSVLSSHGVLLAGYLKDQLKLPEGEIGTFRGLGALFGLISTFSFPYFVRKSGLIESSRYHLGFQVVMVVSAVASLDWENRYSAYLFLLFILLSRVGLYGFSNGEFELRQRLIPETQRGQLNSLSSFLTTFATLLPFILVGSLLSGTEYFKYLVYMSVAAVICGNILFFRWSSNKERSPL